VSETAQFLEIRTLLSRCRKVVCRDYAFGDEEIMWVDDQYNIVAEAYKSSKIIDFWTCPPNYWVFSGFTSNKEPTWEYGQNPVDEPVHYSGSLALDLIQTYKSITVGRNDSGA